jgi:hypothetical protein
MRTGDGRFSSMSLAGVKPLASAGDEVLSRATAFREHASARVVINSARIRGAH